MPPPWICTGALALFIADNFQHMHVEETAHNAVLWARYTDAELMGSTTRWSRRFRPTR